MVFGDLDFLIKLIRMDNDKGKSPVSTSMIAERAGISQQSASRKIISLESDGLIRRTITGSGQKISLTERGTELLEERLGDLKDILEEGKVERFTLSGRVFTGDGEGRYYMGKKTYAEQIREKMGFLPFGGTLNVRLTTKTDIEQREYMARQGGVAIRGFSDGERTFGEAKCFPCRINGRPCGAVIIPSRSRYPKDTLEIISGENLRERFSLKDGDSIDIEVEP